MGEEARVKLGRTESESRRLDFISAKVFGRECIVRSGDGNLEETLSSLEIAAWLEELGGWIRIMGESCLVAWSFVPVRAGEEP